MKDYYLKRKLLPLFVCLFLFGVLPLNNNAQVANQIDLQQALFTLETMYKNNQISKTDFDKRKKRIQELLEQASEPLAKGAMTSVKDDSKEYDIYLKKAKDYKQTNDYNEAINNYQKALYFSKNPHQKAIPYWEVGELYSELKKDTLAKRAFDDYIQMLIMIPGHMRMLVTFIMISMSIK